MVREISTENVITDLFPEVERGHYQLNDLKTENTYLVRLRDERDFRNGELAPTFRLQVRPVEPLVVDLPDEESLTYLSSLSRSGHNINAVPHIYRYQVPVGGNYKVHVSESVEIQEVRVNGEVVTSEEEAGTAMSHTWSGDVTAGDAMEIELLHEVSLSSQPPLFQLGIFRDVAQTKTVAVDGGEDIELICLEPNQTVYAIGELFDYDITSVPPGKYIFEVEYFNILISIPRVITNFR